MTNADAFFTIGRSHTICQDYARAGNTPEGKAFGFIADGCSSSRDTDIGSRALVLAAENILKTKDLDVGFDFRRVVFDAFMSIPKFMPQEAVDTTLLTLVETEVGVEAHAAGDGALAAIRHDGSLEVLIIEFEGGAPAYLSYLLDEKRKDGFIQKGWGKRKTTKYRNGEIVNVEAEDLSSKDAPWVGGYVLPRDEFRAVFAFTDGVQSFQREIQKDGVGRVESVPVLDVIRELTAIKGFTGSFMQRRAKAFLDRFCKEKGWMHYDDVGCAALDLGETP